MGQYNEQVERQKMRLEAEEWANGVRSLHAHQLKSMWYDTRPQDTDLGPVMDVQYNDERVRIVTSSPLPRMRRTISHPSMF